MKIKGINAHMIVCLFLFLLILLLGRQNHAVLLDWEEKIQELNVKLSQYPRDIHTIQSIAIIYAQNGIFNKAAQYFQQLGDISKSPEPYFNAGLAFIQSNNQLSAIQVFTVCGENFNYRPCIIKLASIYRDEENYIQVQKYLHIAIQLDPNQSDAYVYMADTLNNLKQFSMAIKYYKKALQVSKNTLDIKTMMSLADVYSNIKEYDKSMELYQNVLKYIDALSTLQKKEIRLSGYYQASIGYFFSSIELGYWKDFEVTESMILSLALEYNQMMVMMMRMKKDHQEDYQMRTTEVTATETETERRNQNPSTGVRSTSFTPNLLSPYRLLFFQTDPWLHSNISSQWSTAITATATKAPVTSIKGTENVFSHDRNMKSFSIVRIGYLSRRFHDYPGTQMMIRIFENHDHNRVHVSTIAAGPNDNSLYREYIANKSNLLLDISNMSYDESLQQIESLDLDIIIDYDGLHDFNSIKYLSSLQKPIKLTWLGYPGPISANVRVKIPTLSETCFSLRLSHPIEYIIADSIVLPPDMSHTKSYAEKIVYLQGSYQPQDEFRGQGLYPSSSYEQDFHILHRQESTRWEKRFHFLRFNAKISENSMFNILKNNDSNSNDSAYDLYLKKVSSQIWLVCFNRLSKILPDTFEDWMKIMIDSSNTILILMYQSDSAVYNIQANAIYWGIHPKRLVFIPKLHMMEYRYLLELSDLFLDTRNYNAHTVATDGMQEGLPILTLSGTTFASRVASSLNKGAGVDRFLNAYNRKIFVDDGINYIRNPMMISKLRNDVITSKGKCLFNSTQFAKKLEYGYQALMDLHQNNYKYNILRENNSNQKCYGSYHVLAAVNYGTCPKI